MMLFWLSVVMWGGDTLQGVRYRCGELVVRGGGVCFPLTVMQSDRPLYVWLQAQDPDGSWREVQRVLIDKWSLPKATELCMQGGRIGTRVRLVLGGLSASAPKVVVYEGFPWGQLPPPPAVHWVEGSPPLLQISFAEAGQYLLRCYNRYGEEVFTLPLMASGKEESRYAFPASLRGFFLVQLYDLARSKVLWEKTIRL